MMSMEWPVNMSVCNTALYVLPTLKRLFSEIDNRLIYWTLVCCAFAISEIIRYHFSITSIDYVILNLKRICIPSVLAGDTCYVVKYTVDLLLYYTHGCVRINKSMPHDLRNNQYSFKSSVCLTMSSM